MVTISESIPGSITINVSFNQTFSRDLLNELGANQTARIKSQIMSIISNEIDMKLNESFRVSSRQILKD